MHGRPSVAAVTYGAGGFNMVNPIASAYAEKSPVIVISGGPGDSERSTGLLVHHQAKSLNSQLKVYEEVTVDQAILNDPEKAPEQIARVLANCIRHSRPVYLEIPRDKVFLPCQAVPAPPASYHEWWQPSQAALDACAEAILANLAKAEKPVMVADIEIRRFGVEKQVAELARRLQIPVVTTLMGRGLLADAEDIDLRGTYLGTAGDKDLRYLVDKSDAPFLIGTILTDNNFGMSGKSLDLRAVMIAADGQCSMGYHVYENIPLPHLVAKLLEKCPKRTPTKHVIACPETFEYGFTADNAICTPNDIAILLNDHFAENDPMPIASDIGDCFFTTLDIHNTRLVAPGFYATMGFGVPAGFGLQAATGERPIILVGDGAFQMTGWELLNAPRYGLTPIVLVFNNASWEMLRTFQPESQFNDLPQLDFAHIAESLGGVGHTANNRAMLKLAFETALSDTDHFHIIDIQIEKKVLSKTLGKFVDRYVEIRKQK
ncbi:MAG: indolepyruvate/phenylpyruvate decarboxylase [Gammaproteobacteria bacterium]|nr:MAG: indolepyruvate/phenylpyruvate decarboxylase [Gammaproteobacteria bacterium]